MQRRKLGAGGPEVGAIGLGCMGMSDFYGPADRAESIATIHAALDSGATLIDTGDFYGQGHNEMLIAEALKGRPRDSYQLSVKFGALRDPAMNFIGYDARPAAVKNFLTYSLKRLGVEHIDIYRPARLDPEVPIEDTVGAIAEMVQKGYVRAIGLSEVNARTIRRAAAVHPIADLQIEYSLVVRMVEAEILPACRELGIGITAYGVLARGLISGHWTRERSGGRDFRAASSRFSGDNLEHNLTLVEALRSLAHRRGASVAAMAVAWVMARGGDIVPLVGARKRVQWAESAAAENLAFTDADLAAIEAAVPKGAARGDRYPAQAMAHLDSEKRD
ncbi:aryl-alcohol dehydrogenase-like predicted oxidoreductase [Roseiarcus fermentans]|uniref:Aryl-alcohol dehydrogenase-like predicted oxidoreductase n=1 Tax=Roseiarcus fermentans TaxID=1473586 RepID=A0A366FUQ9_9HYPH|nr:aldo/keto reductase [Roseiarcus fermentans]RBP18307.1 aryl-alcohol dehydrogenase-like predicted oxidoreductase [Roseiarcus fermentans]